MRLRTKVLLWLLGSAAFLLLVLIGVFCYVMANLMSDKPLAPPKYVHNMEDFQSAMSTLNRHLSSVLNDELTPGQLSKIKLSRNEVNAILYFMSQKLNFDLNRRYDMPKNYLYMKFRDDNTFEINASKYWENCLPFGDYLNLKVNLNAAITASKTQVKVNSAKIGNFNAPLGFVQKHADRIFTRDFSKQGQQSISGSLIEDMRIENNNLVIYYYPEKFRSVIVSFMDRMQTDTNQSLEFEDFLRDESTFEEERSEKDRKVDYNRDNQSHIGEKE